MPKLPGVPHLVLSDGRRILTIPRHNPANAITMAGIARDAGLTLEQFPRTLAVAPRAR